MKMLTSHSSPGNPWLPFYVPLTFQPTQEVAGVTVPNRLPAPVPQQLSWWDRLDRWFWRQECKQRDRYLAQASDTVDLEQRIRSLERASFNRFF